MKTLKQLINEASPRNVPIEKTTPTPTQKELARRDIGKRQAVKAASGLSNFKQGAAKIADVAGEMERGLERGAAALQQAKEFDASTEKSATGRVVTSPDIKKLAKLNPNLGQADVARMAAKRAEDENETERQRILAMPRGPERDKLLGANMQKRMEFAKRAGDASAGDLGVASSRAVDKEIRAGEGGDAFERSNIDGVDVASQSGLRHNFQGVMDQGYAKVDPREFPDPAKSTSFTNPEDGRGYKYNNEQGRWNPVMSADDVDTLLATVADPTQDTTLTRGADGETVRRTKVQNTELGNNPQLFEPSAAELAYFKRNPEGQKLIKALDAGDSQAVHDIIFSHDVGEIGSQHEAVDTYLNQADTRTDLSRRGLDAGNKLKAVYGGVFEGELGELAKKYQVEGAPDGVYDTKQIEKDGGKRGGKWTNKKLGELYDQIFKNREYEVVRTYLKQGGRDGYVRWEGNRSIEQMNLEHIEALNADDPDAKGWDHPSNWAWASEPLNKAKNKYKLGTVLKKFDEPRVDTKASGGTTFGNYLKSVEKDSKKLTSLRKDFKDRVPALAMNRDEYSKLSQDEIEKNRDDMIKFAQQLGFPITRETAANSLPDRNVKPGFETDGEEAFDASRRQREKERMELDTTLKQVRQITKTSSLDDAAKTPLGKRALDRLANSRAGINIPDVDDDENLDF